MNEGSFESVGGMLGRKDGNALCIALGYILGTSVGLLDMLGKLVGAGVQDGNEVISFVGEVEIDGVSE